MNIEQIRDTYLGAPVEKKGADRDEIPKDAAGKTFGEYFTEIKAAENVRFSKHASRRLDSREIELSDEQKDRLNQATGKARDKGLNEPLVMVDNLAFIVNIKNNTVVTALNDTERSVFTNIDGAIIG